MLAYYSTHFAGALVVLPNLILGRPYSPACSLTVSCSDCWFVGQTVKLGSLAGIEASIRTERCACADDHVQGETACPKAAYAHPRAAVVLKKRTASMKNRAAPVRRSPRRNAGDHWHSLDVCADSAWDLRMSSLCSCSPSFGSSWNYL